MNPDKKFCEGCGAPNDSYSNQGASYPVFSQPNSAASSGQMPAQPIEVPDQDVAVNAVQELLPKDKDIKHCPKCGGELDPDKNFCEKCGDPNDSYAQVDNPCQLFNQPEVSQNTDQLASNSEQESQPDDQSVSDVTSSEDLPVHEDLKKGSSAGRWIAGILIIVVLAGGVLVLGQRLNWWNIEQLSWAGGNDSHDTLADASLAIDTVAASEEVIAIETYEGTEETVIVSEPFTLHLTGTIGGKYPIEVILDGERKGDGFYPASGKYRYTKYGDSWLKLQGTTESVDNTVSYLKLLEYSDGSLTGSWVVRYDMSNNTLRGYMSDSKGEAYSVLAGRGYESSSYNEAEEDSVAY